MGGSTIVTFFTLVIGTLIAFFYLEKQNQIKADEIINRYRNTKPEPTPDIPTDPTPTPVQVDIAPSTGGMMAIRPEITPPPSTFAPAPSVFKTPVDDFAPAPINNNTDMNLFNYFDGDNDGGVSSVEFSGSLQVTGSEISDEQVQMTFDTFDENKDGRLSFAEFGNVLAPDPPSVFESPVDTFAPAPPSVFESPVDTFAPAPPSVINPALEELCDKFPWNNLCNYRPGWTGTRPVIVESPADTFAPAPVTVFESPADTFAPAPMIITNPVLNETNSQFDAICDIQPWQSFCSYRKGWSGVKPPELLGDDAISTGKYIDAIDFFTIAMETSEPNMKYKLYSKRANAYTLIEDFQSALNDADAIDPTTSGENETDAILMKFERRGVALYGLKRFTEAKNVYQSAIDDGYTSSILTLGLKTATIAEEDAKRVVLSIIEPTPNTFAPALNEMKVIRPEIITPASETPTLSPSPSTPAPETPTLSPSPSTPAPETQPSSLDIICASSPSALSWEMCRHLPNSTWVDPNTTPDDTPAQELEDEDTTPAQESEDDDTTPTQELEDDDPPISDWMRNLCTMSNWMLPECKPYVTEDILTTLCTNEPLNELCDGRPEYITAKLNEFCKTDLADPDCSEYGGHLNAFCKENLASPKCEGQSGHLDAFCKTDLTNPKCEGQPGHLYEICRLNLADPKCEGQPGHQEVVELNEFCETNLADPDCSDYVGYAEAVEKKKVLDEKAKLDAFCKGENLVKKECSEYDGHLNALCKTNITDPKCEGQPGYHDTMVALLPSVAPTSYTSSNQAMWGMIYYDRQNIACEDDASINAFNTIPNWSGGNRKLKFDYKCKPKQGTLWKKNKTVKTVRGTVNENNLYASVGMNVDCEEKPISSFRWKRRNGHLEIDYTCVDTNSPNIKPECRTVTHTPAVHSKFGVLVETNCADDEVLTQFKNNSGSPGGVTEYTCCKYPDLPESRKALRKLCSENLWDSSCSEYDGHQEAVEEKNALDALCKTDLADPKCSEYDGHKQAKLDAFCKGENLAKTECSKYDGHLDAFCKGDKLRRWKCSAYDGHEQAKLTAFCKTNLADPQCSAYDGHIDAFCKIKITDPKCEGQLEELCKTNLADPNCSGYDNHDIAVSIANELDDEILAKMCETQIVDGSWNWNADKACRQTSGEMGLQGWRCGSLFGGAKCPSDACCSNTWSWCGSGTKTGSASKNGWCGNRSGGGYIGRDNGRFDGTASQDEVGKIARRPSTFASDVMTRLATKLDLDAFCKGENLADSQCSNYDGHEKAKLNAFCTGIDLADPQCSEYGGHLDAFCTGENLKNPKCEGQPGYITLTAPVSYYTEWSVTDLSQYLRYIGFEKYVDLFAGGNAGEQKYNGADFFEQGGNSPYAKEGRWINTSILTAFGVDPDDIDVILSERQDWIKSAYDEDADEQIIDR